MNGVPDAESGNILIIVTVDVSGCCHLLPRDARVARLEVVRQAARGLGNDFQATRDRIKVQLVAAERLKV